MWLFLDVNITVDEHIIFIASLLEDVSSVFITDIHNYYKGILKQLTYIYKYEFTYLDLALFIN